MADRVSWRRRTAAQPWLYQRAPKATRSSWIASGDSGCGRGRASTHSRAVSSSSSSTAIAVSSTLIILFTIFGAFLQFSGAGKFYIDFSFAAMGGKPSSAGRTVTLASFLLGGPSGSGVATTVTLGAVAAPMLAKVGYSKNEAGERVTKWEAKR